MQVGVHHESNLSVLSPNEGILRFTIEERGVSVVATMDADPSSAAESPVERLGTIKLVAHTQRGQRHSVTVQAEDSPDTAGEFCVRADLIAVTDHTRVSAETAFATAGRATRSHDWNTAFDDYLSAARHFDQLHTRRSSGAARQAMAEIAYLRLDRKRDSYALASEALADYGDSAEPLTVGALTGLQSKALFDIPQLDFRAVAPEVRGLLATARKSLESSRFGARELPRLQIMEGFLEYRLDAPGPARAAFVAAAQSCRKMQDWDCYAIAGQNLAALAYESKNYTVALSAFDDALKQLPPELDPKLAANIWSNYGTLQGRMGLFTDSQRSYATAMREYAQLGDCQGVRRNLSHSGNLMVQLGTLGDAKYDLQQVVSLDCDGLLAAVTGNAHTETARPAAVETGATREYADARGPGTAWCTRLLDPVGLASENKLIVLTSLVSLGHALELEGDLAQAMQCLDAAVPYATIGQPQMQLANARGEVLLERQDATAARVAFEQAVRIADETNVPPAHEYRGYARLGIAKSALLAGDAAGTVRDGLEALQASVSRGDVDQTVASLRLLAAGYRGLNLPEQAARTLQTAVDLIEAVPIDGLDGEKRATYLATQYVVFAELTDLFASGVDTNSAMVSTAFATSERGRARSLRYAATQSEHAAPVTAETLPAARFQQLLQDVVNLNESHLDAAQTTLIDKLDKAALRERKTEDPFDQQQLTQTLEQLHATLVEYAGGTRDMFAFVVNRSGLHAFRLGDRQKIASAAAELQDRLLDAEAPQSEVREAAQRLAALVLWPLSTQLSGKRIIFVPDDGLHTIPFSVLPWSPKASDLLVLQHAEVSIVPSALFLTRIRANSSQHVSAPRIELLGDPVFRISDWRHECTDAPSDDQKTPVAPLSRSRKVQLSLAADGQRSVQTAGGISDWTESLPRLPGSRAEVQMVARLSQRSRPASHIEILLGCAAVPTALHRAASGHVDLLHIATHARVDSQRPRLSALALTPEHRGDGTASAFGLLDILGLKLSSSLVVLSACETSRGRLLPGEGVLGPAQAFLQAGAGAVLASYWRVDDLATSKFMQQFYIYLLSERLPAATALRRAQMDEAETSSPHDWAAFSLYGWPDSSL
jgi:CHAT domain-containing protein/tetratricopeptide (TPR) repeat protein